MTRKIVKIGSSAGVTLPKKELVKRGINVGDEVEVVTGADGNLVISAIKKDKARRNRVAELTVDFVERYRKDLDQLAKE